MISLSGLENIDHNSITDLQVKVNQNLSNCAIKSICNYLQNPNGTIDINNNEEGCNSQEEVLEICDNAGVSNEIIEPIVFIYPNPSKNETFINIKSRYKVLEANVYNNIGKKLLNVNQEINTLDISNLQRGLYIVEVVTKKSKVRHKLIVK